MLPDLPVACSPYGLWLRGDEGSRGKNAKGARSIMRSVISMKALLESGVHFGHRTNKWDPAMKPYIFTERNGIHIIDLQQTAKSMNTIYALVRDTVQSGENILFVGTKRQAQETIREEAIRCDMPYVTERWLGGTLTNWSTIYQRVLELEKLEKMKESGEINKLTKKEGLMIEREIARLQLRLSGLRNIKTLPGLIFVIDVMREATAIHEANLKNIVSPFLKKLGLRCANLTVQETRVADLVKNGKTTKEISQLLQVTPAAVNFHRNNIRKKLGLSNQKANLAVYLASLEIP